MKILGLTTMGNSAACLMDNGRIVLAIEEERLSRIKNDGAFPVNAISYVLENSGLTMQDIDEVTASIEKLLAA